MGKVIVFMNLTLDGVMQGPAEPDEEEKSHEKRQEQAKNVLKTRKVLERK